MTTRVLRLSAVLLAVIVLAGCATVPERPPGTPLDGVRLKHARYLQIISSPQRAIRIAYLTALPRPHHAAAPLVCRHAAPRDRHLARGAWIWKTADLLGHPRRTKAFLRKARALRLNRLYLYLTGPLARYAPLLRAAHRLAIRVYALTGDPSNIMNPGAVSASIKAVEHYNRVHRSSFAGMQFDIEPYTLASFPNHEHAVYRRYVRLVNTIRADIGDKMDWGLVVPFWFEDIRLDHKDLLSLVMRDTDNVTVMAYRTHYKAIIALANNSLCEGDALHRNVYIGLETSPIPDRTDFVLSIRQARRYIHYYRGRPYMDRRITGAKSLIAHHVVLGSYISFYPHIATAIHMTKRYPRYTRFSGWILDGLDEEWHVH